MNVIILMKDQRTLEKCVFFAKRHDRPFSENAVNYQRTCFSVSKNLLIAITEDPERSFNATMASLMRDRVAMVLVKFSESTQKCFFEVDAFCVDCRMLLFGKK
jgi:hypothetical protein